MNTSHGILGQMQSSQSTEKRLDLQDDASNAEPPAEFIAASILKHEQSSKVAVGGREDHVTLTRRHRWRPVLCHGLD